MEDAPEHCRLAEHGAVRGLEPVDPGGHHPFDRLRQLVGALTGLRGRDQLQQEQRVAAGPLRNRTLLERVEASTAGGDLGESGRVLIGERGQLEEGCLPLVDEHGAVRSAGHGEHPGTSADLDRERAEQLERCVVGVVDVLDDQQGRLGQGRGQQHRGGLVHPRGAELLGDRVRLRRRRDLGTEHDRQQRNQGNCRRGQPGGGGPQLAAGVLGARRDRDAQRAAHQRTSARVGGQPVVRLALRGDPHHQARILGRRLHQAALADAGVARDVDHGSVPDSGRRDRVVEDGELRMTPDDGQRRVRLDLAVAGERPDDMGLDRVLLALDQERRQRREPEGRPRAPYDVVGGHHLPGLGLDHQPGREVHGVAHDGVGVAGLPAEEPGEDAPPVHSDVQALQDVARDEVGREPETGLLVLAGRGRGRRRCRSASRRRRSRRCRGTAAGSGRLSPGSASTRLSRRSAMASGRPPRRRRCRRARRRPPWPAGAHRRRRPAPRCRRGSGGGHECRRGRDGDRRAGIRGSVTVAQRERRSRRRAARSSTTRREGGSKLGADQDLASAGRGFQVDGGRDRRPARTSSRQLVGPTRNMSKAPVWAPTDMPNPARLKRAAPIAALHAGAGPRPLALHGPRPRTTRGGRRRRT